MLEAVFVHFELLHSGVVELEPLVGPVPVLDQRIVVASVGLPTVDHHPNEVVGKRRVYFPSGMGPAYRHALHTTADIGLRGLRGLGDGLFSLPNAFGSVRSHFEGPRKLKVIIELDCSIRLPVIVEPFELDDERFGQAPDAHSLDGASLFLALFAEVGVVPVQKLATDKLVQGLEKAVGLDGQIQRHEGLLSLVTVRTVLANHLVGEDALEKVGTNLGLLFVSQQLIHLIEDLRVKFECILLLANVHLLAKEPEVVPELVGHVILQLGSLQVAEQVLQLVENALFLDMSILRFILAQWII